MLNENKYIIDHKKPHSLGACFITAFSIYIFFQLITYIFSAVFHEITGYYPHHMLQLFFATTITTVLLILYYDYLPWKYLSAIILLITSQQLMIFLIIGLPSYFVTKYILFPVIEFLPSGERTIMLPVLEFGGNLSETFKRILGDTVQFFIIVFLMMIFLKYAKRHISNNISEKGICLSKRTKDILGYERGKRLFEDSERSNDKRRGDMEENRFSEKISFTEYSRELSRHDRKKLFFESLAKELDEMKEDMEDS